jgi:hypothetical protein
MPLLCEAIKTDASDSTGELGQECNAPAEYCPVCDLTLCAACHIELTESRTPHQKKPVVPAVAGKGIHIVRKA